LKRKLSDILKTGKTLTKEDTESIEKAKIIFFLVSSVLSMVRGNLLYQNKKGQKHVK